MCGAFLEATAVSQPPNTSPAGARLRIDVHVGDALDFCDALSAVPPASGGDDASEVAPPSPIPPVAFQRGTIQPLELKEEVVRGAGRQPAFDVIKSSNLADHLGESDFPMSGYERCASLSSSQVELRVFLTVFLGCWVETTVVVAAR